MNAFILDLSSVKSEEDFHAVASRVFDFPHYYGRNLDAFWDCITEIFDPTLVRVLYPDSLPAEIRPTIEPYIHLLREYEEQRAGKFVVEVVR